MRMFCKHDYVMKIAKDIVPIDYDFTDKGIVLKGNTKLGCIVYCNKCGKQKKRLAQKIVNLYANSIKNDEQERVMKEVINMTTLPNDFI